MILFVKVSHGNGQMARILIDLDYEGRGTWQTIDKGFFCHERGVAATGSCWTDPVAWICLYGGDQVDDRNLVLHLDGFMNFTGFEPSGEGVVYKEDNLLMDQGEVAWELTAI